MDDHISFGVILREEVERWASEDGLIKLSDAHWKKIADEIEGRVDNFLDNLLYDIILDIREGVYDE